jgi:hypothetical protein
VTVIILLILLVLILLYIIHPFISLPAIQPDGDHKVKSQTWDEAQAIYDLVSIHTEFVEITLHTMMTYLELVQLQE